MGQALSRSESREVAFRILFAQPTADAFDLQAPVWQLALDGKTAPAPEQQYILRVVQTAHRLYTTHNAQITSHLQKWTLDRLRQTDLAAIRLALAEIALGEVPVPVVINEAVNLAKKYGEPQSGSFVNGILAQLTA